MKAGKGIDLGKMFAEAADLYMDVQGDRVSGRRTEFTVEQDIELLVSYPNSIKEKFCSLFVKRHRFGSKETLKKRYDYLRAVVGDNVKKYDPEKVCRITPKDY